MDEIEVFATGIQMGESPRWHDGRFWMCDWLAGEVLVFAEDGSREVAARVEGMPFSIDWLPDGRLVVTADGTTLLVAESHADRITAFTLAADGSLSDRRVWADLGPGAAPDGICLDAEGALWYASVPQQHCRRVAEGGAVLDTLPVGQPCFACMLGGEDGRTLYVVANDYSDQGVVGNGRVLRARVEVPHAGRP